MLNKIKALIYEIIRLPQRKMNHKYIKELDNQRYMFPFFEIGYPSFDVRDTWNLNTTFICWLYERLRYFEDVAGKTINLTGWTYEIDGHEITQIECIKRMQDDCRYIIEHYAEADIYAATEEDKKMQESVIAAKDDLFKIFSEVFWEMWW